MTNLVTELRQALRSARKNLAFTIVAVLTLAVGVGANTAIFSVLHAVVLRALPYHEPDRLAVLWTLNIRQNLRDGSSYLNFQDWKTQSRAFEDMAAYRRPENTRVTIGGGAEPDRVQVGVVGPGFFRVLGAQALLGRTLDSPDFDANHRAAILSHSFWRQRFAGSTRILGESIVIDGTAYEVIGVMPPDAEYPTREVKIWLPVSMQANWNDVRRDEKTRGADSFIVLGRLRPAATIASARAELGTIAGRLRALYPQANGGKGILIDAFVEHVIGARTERSLWLLFGAVGFVLLIACVNVANLALARGGARQSEFALRAALGASRGRLVREALSEQVVVAVVAAGGGLLVGWLGARALRTWASAALPRLESMQLDASMFLFALGASLACGLLAGLLPAWQLSALNPAGALRESGTRVSGSRGSRRLQRGLVIAEIALAVVLLSGAGLLIRSFVQVQAADRGLDARQVLLLRVDLPARYQTDANRLAYFREALQRIRALPGVAAAGAIRAFFIHRQPDVRIAVEGRPAQQPDDPAPPLTIDPVLPGYFEAMGIPLRRGRLLQETDLDAGSGIVVINEEMARRFWPGEDPIGKRFKGGLDPAAEGSWTTVVGVVGDMRRQRLDEPAIPYCYRADTAGAMDIAVRAVGDPIALRDAIRAELRALDPATPPYSVMTVERWLQDTVALRTLQTMLLGILAMAALVLAVIGVYGIVHRSVAARTREIGVRIALGASTGSVLSMVLSSALALAAGGLTIGLVGAALLRQTISSFLYQTSPNDPFIYATVSAILIVVTIVACLAPARRAARVDPIAALRCQ